MKSDWGGGGPILLEEEMRGFINRENLCCLINFNGVHEPQTLFSLRVDSHNKEVILNDLGGFI